MMCLACNGTGTITCADCGGTGLNPVPEERNSLIVASRDADECRNCSGTGESPCPNCNGRGSVPDKRSNPFTAYNQFAWLLHPLKTAK